MSLSLELLAAIYTGVLGAAYSRHWCVTFMAMNQLELCFFYFE